MDETPEELEQIKREADAIDPYQYRKRRRLIGAVALGMLAAGAVWGGLELYDRARNPCQRVRDYYCKSVPGGASCSNFDLVFHESVEDESPKMRSSVRAQCERRIEILAEEGITVK